MHTYIIDDSEYTFDTSKFNSIFSKNAKNKNMSIPDYESFLSSKLKKSRSIIHNWRMGKAQPEESILQKLADDLICEKLDFLSLNYLYGIRMQKTNGYKILFPKDIKLEDINAFCEKINDYFFYANKNLPVYAYFKCDELYGFSFCLSLLDLDKDYHEDGLVFIQHDIEDENYYYLTCDQNISEHSWDSIASALMKILCELFEMEAKEFTIKDLATLLNNKLIYSRFSNELVKFYPTLKIDTNDKVVSDCICLLDKIANVEESLQGMNAIVKKEYVEFYGRTVNLDELFKMAGAYKKNSNFPFKLDKILEDKIG